MKCFSFGSVCSGIEAASVAFGPLDMHAAWLAEIEPFPSAVLAHHYPGVPNLGDMTQIADRVLSGEVLAPDLFCGGTPCQAFSVAGLRKSLDDARGNLSLVFCELVNAIDQRRADLGLDPTVVFWENVPGVLSTKDNAFGCFLAGLAGEGLPLLPAGGKWTNAGCVFGPQRAVAWRVLDAQYFGVAQRRRRVFVVASARNDFNPAAVLFEFDGVRRDSAPSREARQGVAGGIEIGPGGGRFTDLNPTLDTRAKDGPVRNQLAGAVMQPYTVGNYLTARMHKGINSTLDEGQTPVISFHPTQDPINSSDGTTHCIGTGSSKGNATVAVAVSLRGREGGATAELGDEVQNCLRASQGGGDKPHVLAAVAHTLKGEGFDASEDGTGRGTPLVPVNMAVRRLTPVECERLQGFPDNYTAIPWRKKPASECPDGPRYKALGNSWAVPVVRWIGGRIRMEVLGGLA